MENYQKAESEETENSSTNELSDNTVTVTVHPVKDEPVDEPEDFFVGPPEENPDKFKCPLKYPFKCPICKCRFSKLSYFREHHLAAHKKEFPYLCQARFKITPETPKDSDWMIFSANENSGGSTLDYEHWFCV